MAVEMKLSVIKKFLFSHGLSPNQVDVFNRRNSRRSVFLSIELILLDRFPQTVCQRLRDLDTDDQFSEKKSRRSF